MSAYSYASLFSLTFIICNVLQSMQLWTKADFFACNLNSPAPIITVVIANTLVKIVQLRRSRHHLLRLHASSSVQIELLLQRERGWTPSLSINPNPKTPQQILCNPYNLRIIVKSSPALRDFFRCGFPRKNHVPSSLFFVVISILHLYPHFPTHMWCG